MYVAIEKKKSSTVLSSAYLMKEICEIRKEFQERWEWGSMYLYPCADDRKKRGGGRREGMGARRLICRQWSGPGIDDEVSEAFEVRRASRRGGTNRSNPSECWSWSWCGSVRPFRLSVPISPVCLNACQKLKLRSEKTMPMGKYVNDTVRPASFCVRLTLSQIFPTNFRTFRFAK